MQQKMRQKEVKVRYHIDRCMMARHMKRQAASKRAGCVYAKNGYSTVVAGGVVGKLELWRFVNIMRKDSRGLDEREVELRASREGEILRLPSWSEMEEEARLALRASKQVSHTRTLLPLEVERINF